MDKENKDIAMMNNASYDPDAAELLKDLEDDEDDEYQPEVPSSPANRSIVNILNSSTNLEAIASIPAGSAVQHAANGLTTANSLASANDLTPDAKISDAVAQTAPAAESSNASDNSASTTADVSTAHSDNKSDDAANVKDDSAPAEISKFTDASKDDASDSDAAAKTTIKPFEAKPIKKDEPVETKVEAKTPKKEEIAEEAALTNNKKPPVPPPTPSPAPAGSSANAGRALREGEMIVTQEMINDILPGGKNDEARDLASFKFNDNNWYAQVFNEDFFRTVPPSSPRQTAREAKFIIERLGIESGARVLDLCCGFGRHTIELAKHKFDMVGLDLSMVMLKKALADAQANGLAIKFVHGDMRKLSFKAIFDAIYNVQTSFGYFDDQSNFKVLQGIYNALKPGGVFLIETVNRDFIINDLPLRLWWKGNECTLLEEIDSEVSSGLLKVQRSFVFDVQSRAPWEQKIQIRLYSANEMRALLTRAGFKVFELSGDYSLPRAHFGATSPRNIFVAEKPVK